MVDRYKIPLPDAYSFGPNVDGAWVRHDDYKALESKLSTAENLIASQEKAQQDLDRAQRALHEANIDIQNRLDERTKERDAAENRWKLAMRRLHERFGDGLAVHKADIEKLLASWETDKGVRVEVYDGPNTPEPPQ